MRNQIRCSIATVTIYLMGTAVYPASGRLLVPLTLGGFDDVRGTVEVTIGKDQIAGLVVEQTLYRDGDALERRLVPVDRSARSGLRFDLPLDLGASSLLEDGAYALVVEMRAQEQGAEGSVFTLSRTIEFEIEAGRMRFVTQHEYARWLDEADSSIGKEDNTAAVSGGDSVEIASLPNLRTEGISHQAYCGADSMCSVVFYNTVCNRGTGTAWSFAIGMKGWGTPTIATCTGLWRATNTSSSLAPGSCRSIIAYGPGYVGPKVRRGTDLSVTGQADVYCQVPESSEWDNGTTRTIVVGY